MLPVMLCAILWVRLQVMILAYVEYLVQGCKYYYGKVRRNIASKVASYVACNTTSNIIYKVECHNTYKVTRKKACEVASSACLLCNIIHKVTCKVISCK